MWEWEIPQVLPLGRIYRGNFKRWSWRQTLGGFVLEADTGEPMWNSVRFECFGFSPAPSGLPEGSATERMELCIKKAFAFLLGKAVFAMALFRVRFSPSVEQKRAWRPSFDRKPLTKYERITSKLSRHDFSLKSGHWGVFLYLILEVKYPVPSQEETVVCVIGLLFETAYCPSLQLCSEWLLWLWLLHAPQSISPLYFLYLWVCCRQFDLLCFFFLI